MAYALPLYAVTLFISAFILFLVQPIVGKIILPKLGGTPQVWNTCMVFFQMVLLAGYAYTHNVSTRLTLRQQIMLHAVVLCLPLIVLVPFPFAFGGSGDIVDGVVTNPRSLWGFVPDLGSNPIPSTLAILFLYVALPFFVVSTSAPLLQKWFVHTGHPAAKDPYFLYGASNAGSALSLVVYPALVEPFVSLQDQGWTYTFGYLMLVVFVVICATMAWNSKEETSAPKHEATPEPAPSAPATATTPADATPAAATDPAGQTGVKPGQPKHAPKATGAPGGETPPSIAKDTGGADDELTFGRRLRWVLLAAIPSSLMLGVTTHITTDLSPMPLFWLIPLFLYLVSFILVFARWPVVWTEQPHVYFLYAQPVFVWLMIMTDVWSLTSQPAFIAFAIFAHVAGFFATTMVCHGEMAKDRPGTKHLTEFFLWMSVGGMVGGMFNALFAPIVFYRGLWEFPLAIFAAGLVRPKMFDIGFLDNWVAGMFEGSATDAAHKGHQKGHKHAAPTGSTVTANESLVQTLDLAWPFVILVLTALLSFALAGLVFGITDSMMPAKEQRTHSEGSTTLGMIVIFGIPLALACLCFARNLRVGLAIGAVLLTHQIYTAIHDGGSIYHSRSYFGAISVKESKAYLTGEGAKETLELPYRQLIHGHINHGMNFNIPEDRDKRGDVVRDRSRLATTYYHRDGPAGRVMEKFNWWNSAGNPNTFHADARLPASIVGSVLDPLAGVVAAFSEPALATIGLGTGTMASYGRPYQAVHFYEIDNQVLRLSLATPSSEINGGTWENEEPDSRGFLHPRNMHYKSLKANARHKTYFNYLEQAIDRGCSVQVLMGDARLRMALPYKNHYVKILEDGKTEKLNPNEKVGGGPDNFYHMMVVDAFSSDAIPAHLLTKQAFELYFRKLTKDGVLCVHTSNRFVDLPKVVAAVSSDITWHEATLGLQFSVLADEEYGALKLPLDEGGVVVKKVDSIKANKGDNAEIKVGDILLRVNNIPLQREFRITDPNSQSRNKSLAYASSVIADLKPNAEVKLKVKRGDAIVDVKVTTGKKDFQLAHLRGHDSNDKHEAGHFTSEWVMVARKAEYLTYLTNDTAFLTKYKNALRQRHPDHTPEEYWRSIDNYSARHIWTDDYYNLLSVIRFR
ncbi:MAG: PDZ domain-containing protein [Planctomycetes bacterium]|nr:PDZ domain-containing protein [Planctomycetota bacterium]